MRELHFASLAELLEFHQILTSGQPVNGCRFPRKSGVGIKPDVVTRGSRRTALILL
jgi:hypothetical protein